MIKRSRLFGMFMVWVIGIGVMWPVYAEEGMFLLYETAKVPWQELQKNGLKLSSQQVQALAPAVVQLARGGTGSFVSKGGLIVTNHHVAYGCLARLDATTHKGLMKKGYVAASREKEVHCPGYDMMVVVRLEDVTEKVRSVLKLGMKPEQQAKLIRTQRRTLEAACEKGTGLICEVSALNGGAGFTLSAYRRLLDVRLVYAPAGALGKFGGDIDNWRYPRHTADFTFLRAYVGADGHPANYSPKNRPFAPAHYLKISTKPLQRGDLTMVMGFPGRTSRHASYAQAKYYYERAITQRALLFRALIDAMPKKGLGKRRYQGLSAGLNNGAKYYEDLKTQFDHFKLLERKKQQQQVWLSKFNGSHKIRKEHAQFLGQIEKIFEDYRDVDQKALYLTYMQSSILRSLQTAVDLVKWSKIRSKSDLERPGERFRDKNMYRVYRESDMLERLITLGGERKLLTRYIQMAYALPAAQRPKVVEWLYRKGQKQAKRLRKRFRKMNPSLQPYVAKLLHLGLQKLDPIEVAVAWLFHHTALIGKEKDALSLKAAVGLRQALFKAEEKELRAAKDPLLQLAVRIVDEVEALEKGPLAPMNKVLGPIYNPLLVQQIIQPSYWDANFTLRFNYGTVQDYTESKSQKKYFYMTTLQELLKKGTDKHPFVVPASLKKVAAAKQWGTWRDPSIKDVPVNFTATLDTTGGNSGSPVLNGAGELMGLLFDGTPESILSDWQYIESEQRSICMDIRFALFLADKVDGAHALLKELGIASSKDSR
ncbi:S46 family peptidase [Myxococcota bacterium]|nr:S46 family peptidase [Myxococcota bacterium]